MHASAISNPPKKFGVKNSKMPRICEKCQINEIKANTAPAPSNASNPAPAARRIAHVDSETSESRSRPDFVDRSKAIFNTARAMMKAVRPARHGVVKVIAVDDPFDTAIAKRP